jgi:2-dehydro-3-deoxyphosphogluconate aldolase/(4S)-4-hydroxy-2-oxoglutarate aldolase
VSDRIPLPTRLFADRVVVVLRSDDARYLDGVAETLVEEGLGLLEVTFTLPQAEEAISRLSARFGVAAAVGAGTVTSVGLARTAVEHGAAYLVSPVFDAGVSLVAAEAHIPYLPGCLTPTEIHVAWQAGASAVKVFPASAVQPSYAKALSGPMPEVLLMPSGGVSLDDVSPWLQAGAVAVSLGGELVGDALRGGSLDALRGRARLVRDAVGGRS